MNFVTVTNGKKTLTFKKDTVWDLELNKNDIFVNVLNEQASLTHYKLTFKTQRHAKDEHTKFLTQLNVN